MLDGSNGRILYEKPSAMRIGLIAAALLCLAACAGLPPQTEINPGAAPLGKYSTEEILTEAKALLVAVNVGADFQGQIIKSLTEFLAQPDNIAKIEAMGVNSVGAFEAGGGGMFFSAGRGGGLVSFAGGSQKVDFEFSGFSFGGNVGGGSTFGIVLSMGLAHEEKFPDRYRMTTRGGAFGDVSYMIGMGNPEGGTHRIHCLGHGIGFGGNAGGGRLTIAMR